jgi:AraC family transcriptional activator of pobA
MNHSPRLWDSHPEVAPVSVTRFHSGTACSAHPSEKEHVSRTFVTHRHATIAYCTSGHSMLEQNGIWRLQAGDVFLVPAGQPHRRISSDGAAYWGLGLCTPSLSRDPDLACLDPFERVRNGAGAVVQLPTSRRPYFEQLLEELAGATRITSEAPPAVQRSLLLLVLNEIQRASTDDSHSSVQLDVVTQSLRYIERHCLEPLTLRDIAAAVGRSPAYVTTALTRHTGQSAKTWITSGRMAEARRLLRHSCEPVTAIAYRVGYADVTHFIRTFRRHHGVTPSKYRLRHANQNPMLDHAVANS